MIRAAMIAALLAFGALAQGASGALTAPERLRLFEEANATFDEGARVIASDRQAGIGLLDESVAMFERVIDEGGIENGRIYYNIGNARALQGDTGGAVLNYRRALRLMPGDATIERALESARRRVEGRVEAPGSERAERLLLAWHYRLAPGTRFGLLAVCSLVFWGVALARTWRVGPRSLWWLGGFAGAMGLAMLGSLVASDRAVTTSGDAVVMTSGVVGRKGPDDAAYQPSFNERLHAGTEVSVVERRLGWALVRLADGRETWLPERTIEPVSRALPES